MEFIEEKLWALCFISSSQQFYKMIYYCYLTNEEIEAEASWDLKAGQVYSKHYHILCLLS